MKLISMTDFVLDKQRFKEDSDTAIFKITNYANFLKQPLKLEMFIPCDENGNVLEEPVNYSAYEVKMSAKDFSFNFIDCQEYEIAKEKVLFEGFSLRIDVDLKVLLHEETKCVRTFFNFNDAFKGMKVEDMVHKNYELTPNAIKQLGL